jgi:hypothetical protein
MKRDMELFRKILLHIEDTDSIGTPDDHGTDMKKFVGHIALINDEEFITGVRFEQGEYTESGFELIFFVVSHLRLTNPAHEFIAAARNPTTWEAAKTTLAGAGQDLGGVTIGVLQGLLVKIASASIGL